MAHPLLAKVRDLFDAQCGYCGVSEIDCGGELTVDHFHPLSAAGSDTLENLVYSCHRCNNYKAHFTATPEDIDKGRRILHPLSDHLADHYRLNTESGQLEPLSKTGGFHIELLHLNRAALVRHRLRKRMIALSFSQRDLLREENRHLAELLERYRLLILKLRKQLGLPPDR